MGALNILLADDSHDYMVMLAHALHSEQGWQVVAMAGDGMEAIDQARQHRPDIVLMDLSMPRLNGVEATRRILQEMQHIKIVMLTAFDHDEALLASAQAGARGYIVKGADRAEIVRVIQAAQQGEWLWGSSIADKLMRLLLQNSGSLAQANPQPFPDLTERELDVLRLIARGVNNDEIAARLFISANTVRNHITHIFDKLQVRDRAQAIARARDAGL